MVQGIEKFREYFKEFTGQYVLIGGSACSVLIDGFGGNFRVTKDFDVVLLVEYLDEYFGVTFWKFIEDGKYARKQKSNGDEQFYRFSDPEADDFPKMIELFSRKPDGINLKMGSHLSPIPFEESISSLSAILLNDYYYEMLLNGRRVVDGFSVLDLEYIILFKIRAWKDLSKRKEEGEPIDSRNIKKHKNDIFRLIQYSDPEKKIEITGEVKNDFDFFMEKIPSEQIDLKNLGIKNITFEQMMNTLYSIFVRE